MSTTEAVYLGIGLLIGWITKIPFLWKWYRDLKSTRAYERMDMYRRAYKATQANYYLEKAKEYENDIR